MRILLIQARLSFFAGNLMPLMNLPALSAYLKQAGYKEVEMLHMDLFPPGKEGVEERLRAFKPDIVGIGAMTAQAKSMHEVAGLVKRILPGALVVAGGPHPTSRAADCAANPAIDALVLHEGELTLLDLVRCVEEKKTFDGVKGIGFRRDGRLVLTPPREFIEDLDSLPLPDWEAVDFNAYRDCLPTSMLGFGKKVIGIITSRGCPYHCIFCHHQLGSAFRAHSPARVLRDIAVLHDKYGVRDIEIIDDIINFDRDRLKAILRGIIAGGMKIRLYMAVGLRGDLLDEETIDLMRAAGVVYLTVAVETGSPRMQKIIKKDLDLDKMKKMIAYAAKKRIFLQGLFLVGFPGETPDDVRQTVRYALGSRLHSMMVGTCCAYKGTELGDTISADKAPQAADACPGSSPDNNIKGELYCPVLFDTKPDSYGYHVVNCSDISDRRLNAMKFLMNVRFYYNPLRAYRILRDMPFRNLGLMKIFFRKLLNKTLFFR